MVTRLKPKKRWVLALSWLALGLVQERWMLTAGLLISISNHPFWQPGRQDNWG